MIDWQEEIASGLEVFARLIAARVLRDAAFDIWRNGKPLKKRLSAERLADRRFAVRFLERRAKELEGGERG